MPSIQIEQNTFKRLQRAALAFVDTPDSVIRRALDALDDNSGSVNVDISKESIKLNYTDRNLPSLKHTKVMSAVLDGRGLSKPNWNSLLDEVLLGAKKSGLSVNEIRAVGGVNVVDQMKSTEGFHPVGKTGMSVQGQDAVRACSGALAIGRKIGMKIEVEFVWRDKEGAAHPGKSGLLCN